jgi:transcriptional regulator of nitric oxide reductase
MAESPRDLAVAFRSFGRRLDEALAPATEDPSLADAGSPSANELAAQLAAVVASAASEVRGVTPTDDVHVTGEAIAAAISRTPSDDWTDARLDRLRSLALEAGRILRLMNEAIEAAQKSR